MSESEVLVWVWGNGVGVGSVLVWAQARVYACVLGDVEAHWGARPWV